MIQQDKISSVFTQFVKQSHLRILHVLQLDKSHFIFCMKLLLVEIAINCFFYFIIFCQIISTNVDNNEPLKHGEFENEIRVSIRYPRLIYMLRTKVFYLLIIYDYDNLMRWRLMVYV